LPNSLNRLFASFSTVNKNLQQLSMAFAWYGADLEIELDGDPIEDAHYRSLLDLFNQYIEPHREDGGYDLYQSQSEFLWPLITILGHLSITLFFKLSY
jgi:hypothetical protein